MALFVILLRILKSIPFEFEKLMSQQSVKKICSLVINGIRFTYSFSDYWNTFLAAKSDAQNKKQYEQQRLEMEKRIAEKEAANSDKK